MRIAFINEGAPEFDLVYRSAQRQRLGELADLLPGVIAGAQLAERADELAEVEAVFSTWGMPRLEAEQLELLPRLRAVFYAAGSVKKFAGPMLERGITVCSGWQANAVPVAEFALAHILLALKGWHRNVREYDRPGGDKHGSFRGRGAYGASVALVGYGQIARRLRALLRHHDLQVLVVDPYLSAEEAEAEGVELVELAEAFRRAEVVSNHLPKIEATHKLIDAAVLGLLPENATFLNTGRGASVDEAALVALCRERADLTAILDVPEPEPPPADSPLHVLPNVHLSGHIAGAINDERRRIGDWMIAEFERWLAGEPLRYAVDAQRLAIMA